MPRILVVDDEAMIRDVIRLQLERAGYEVVCAEDGRQAAQLIADESVDLMITDIFMPETDGYEAIRAARVRRPGLPVIAMSGGAAGVLPDPRLALTTADRLGAVEVLAKPFRSEELTGAVERALAAARS